MSGQYTVVPVIIPSYEPDKRLINLLKDLSELSIEKGYDKKGIAVPVVLVDDGSGEEFQEIFRVAKENYHCIVIRHFMNMGKGRGLKDAFNYCLCTYPDMPGCVTADSDGQHTPEDIFRCVDACRQFPKALILGTRDFDSEKVPVKSRIGNKLTRSVCRAVCGIHVSDTQTGLRAVPKEYMSFCLNIKGERFEFETRMLLESRDKAEIREIPVQTVYDSKGHHKTHFDPVRDSVRIYSIFCEMFLKFVLSSISCCILDLWIFVLFSQMTQEWKLCILISTVAARVISASFNYLLNYVFVFNSRKEKQVSAGQYAVLAFGIMILSAVFVSFGTAVFPHAPLAAVKACVDSMLFIVSYVIQREFVFKEKM